MGVKLWHDDVRPAPEGWIWARTNTEAKGILVCGIGPDGKKTDNWVEEISMDHDLGGHVIDYSKRDEMTPEEFEELMYFRGRAEETGLDLAKWLAGSCYCPEKITIHSWNPEGARRMAQVFNDAGHDVIVAPYDMSQLPNWAR